MSKFKDIIDGETPVLVDFFAEWCGPCKMMPPILKDVKTEMKDKIRIIKVDVDKNPSISSKFQIKGVPTMILFKEGKVLWRDSGVIPASQLVQTISKLVN